MKRFGAYLRKKLNKRLKGVSSMIFPSLMIIVILLVILLYTFRIQALNATFNYIDDAMVSSVLGGALLNVEEYGKSNQVVIYSDDKWVNATDLGIHTGTNGWTPREATIMLSNLNEGSDIELQVEDLDVKQVLDPSSTASGSDNCRTQFNDEYMTRMYNMFFSNLTYNLSNGKKPVELNLSSLANLPVNCTTIPEAVLDSSFVGGYVIGDAYITRFDVYNVYRQDVAREYTFIPYDGFNEYLNAEFGGGLLDKTKDPIIDAYRDFKALMDADGATSSEYDAYFDADGNLRGSGHPLTDEYLKKYAPDDFVAKFRRWLSSEKAQASLGGVEKVYIDNKSTWQGKANDTKPPKMNTSTGSDVLGYKFAFNAKDYNNTEYTSAAKIDRANGEKALKTGYTVYSYKGDCDLGNNKGGTATFKYVDMAPGNQTITIDGGKMDGANIENTAIYLEITFYVGTFPTDITPEALEAYNNHEDYNELPAVHKCTVARLIDIELAD